jgi:hypothetical protein
MVDLFFFFGFFLFIARANQKIRSLALGRGRKQNKKKTPALFRLEIDRASYGRHPRKKKTIVLKVSIASSRSILHYLWLPKFPSPPPPGAARSECLRFVGNSEPASHHADETRTDIYGPCGVRACTLGIYFHIKAYISRSQFESAQDRISFFFCCWREDRFAS